MNLSSRTSAVAVFVLASIVLDAAARRAWELPARESGSGTYEVNLR